jgi:signal transduction histidine kinase
LLTGLRIAGSPRSVSALGATQVSLPDLKATENHLQIDFVGLSFVPGETLRYRYRLEGADADWSPPTELRTVNYAGLAPGRYRFLVRAENSDGAISPTPASVTFEILPPFWQRWWFLLATAMSVVVAGYALHRYRVSRLLEVERVRTHIAADLHDDIGSNLTQIAILSEVAHGCLNQAEQMEGLLSSIARISRESVASMSDIVWAINPRRDSLLDLVRRMRRFANEVLVGRIQFQFRTPEGEQQLKLGADIRRDVFLVFKEVLNNAVRHSACENVDIELRLERSWLVLRIVDNGHGFDPTGFDPTVSAEGQGLASMKRRAASLRSQFEVKSNPGLGTEIVLKVPLL